MNAPKNNRKGAKKCTKKCSAAQEKRTVRRAKVDIRRLHRVFRRHDDAAVEATALERGVRRPRDRKVPLEQLILWADQPC